MRRSHTLLSGDLIVAMGSLSETSIGTTCRRPSSETSLDMKFLLLSKSSLVKHDFASFTLFSAVQQLANLSVSFSCSPILFQIFFRLATLSSFCNCVTSLLCEDLANRQPESTKLSAITPPRHCFGTLAPGTKLGFLSQTLQSAVPLTSRAFPLHALADPHSHRSDQTHHSVSAQLCRTPTSDALSRPRRASPVSSPALIAGLLAAALLRALTPSRTLPGSLSLDSQCPESMSHQPPSLA